MASLIAPAVGAVAGLVAAHLATLRAYPAHNHPTRRKISNG